MPIFNDAQMIESAEQSTGLSDWGDEGFREPLAVLVKSLNEEAKLSDAGHAATLAHLDNILIQRLRLVDDRKTRPEITTREIVRPLFMTGLPRAGTSFLNSLMAQDPANLPPLHWQMWCPSPPPNDPAIDHRAQIERTRMLMDMQGFTAPDMRIAHHYDALNAEESGHMCEFSLVSVNLTAFWDVPSYTDYLFRASYVPAYEWHRRVMQALQVGAEGRRWILKAPEHLYNIKALLEIFPDARLVVNHRDPSRVLASVLSMIAVHWKYFGNKPLRNDRATALRMMEQLAWSMESLIELRKDRELDRRILDVNYLDLERDPLRQVERVYAHMEAEFTDSARQAAARYFAENRKGRFGGHKYALADYSLRQEEVQERLGGYTRHYNIELEPGA